VAATILLAAAMSLATACVPPEELARRQDMDDFHECKRLGYQPGTEGMADCRLRLREIRAQEDLARAYRTYPVEYRHDYWWGHYR
jgi:hypothetical protein